ncbi:MAG: hypothetical protein H6581_03950 [Bacteroidia bacterium]|nr:hypothetical protein [Bacteroidia bacterium]
MATKGPANVVQMASINDYADRNNPAHDPSRLSDTQIRATDEYIEMARAHYYIPTTDPSILYSLEEITLATRLALRSIREGNSFTVASNGQTFLDRAKEQLGTVRHIEGQANNLHWSAFSSQDAATNPSVLQSQYAKWILLNQPEPNPNSGIMNCWEMVMYGAYRAGYVTVSRLRQIYLTANSSFVTRYNHIVDQVRNHGADPNSFTFPSFGDTFESEIRASSEYIFDPSNSNSPSPLPGDIVIFNRAAGHAAISTGTVNSNGQHEIMSLWTQNRGRIVRTTIEALLADGAGTPVKFWSARW